MGEAGSVQGPLSLWVLACGLCSGLWAVEAQGREERESLQCPVILYSVPASRILLACSVHTLITLHSPKAKAWCMVLRCCGDCDLLSYCRTLLNLPPSTSAIVLGTAQQPVFCHLNLGRTSVGAHDKQGSTCTQRRRASTVQVAVNIHDPADQQKDMGV